MVSPAVSEGEGIRGGEESLVARDVGGGDLPSLPFEKLNKGDADAVETVFAAYEPQLRLVVRRQLPPRLRAKFDSGDVIQSVWASVLQGLREEGWQFTDETHLRAFLVRTALFRFIDLCRHHRTSIGRERPLAALEGEDPRTAKGDQPSEIVQARELLERLTTICSPAHRELLRLRMMGYPLAEIAARTGFHEGSIRRIFYELARRLDGQGGAKGRRPESTDTEP